MPYFLVLQQEAQAGKPAVVGMERQVEMAKNGVDLAQKQQLPDYQFRIAYKDRKQSGMDAAPDTWKMEFMVMLPLWQDKNKAEIKSATANLEAAQASLTSAKADYLTALAQIYVAMGEFHPDLMRR